MPGPEPEDNRRHQEGGVHRGRFFTFNVPGLAACLAFLRPRSTSQRWRPAAGRTTVLSEFGAFYPLGNYFDTPSLANRTLTTDETRFYYFNSNLTRVERLGAAELVAIREEEDLGAYVSEEEVE